MPTNEPGIPNSIDSALLHEAADSLGFLLLMHAGGQEITAKQRERIAQQIFQLGQAAKDLEVLAKAKARDVR